MKKRHGFRNRGIKTLAAIVFLMCFILIGAAGAGDWPKDVNVITPAPGASVHMIAVGIGKSVQDHTPIENWFVQPLGGPKLWLPMMSQGKCDFANHNAADILNAFTGRRPEHKHILMPCNDGANFLGSHFGIQPAPQKSV